MPRNRLVIVLCGLALCLLTASARAQLIFALDPLQAGPAGSSVFFNGTITNNSGNDVFLNDLGVVFVPPGDQYLSSDETFFFNNVPGIVSNGDTYVGPVMQIDISSTAPSGNYLGTATLLDNPAPGGNPISNPANFRVTVTPAPGGLTSAGIVALCGAGFALCRRRRHTPAPTAQERPGHRLV